MSPGRDDGSVTVQGKITAIVAADPFSDILIRSAPDRFKLLLDKPITTRGEAFAVRKGDLQMLAYLNTWIQAYTYDTWLPSKTNYWFEDLNWAK